MANVDCHEGSNANSTQVRLNIRVDHNMRTLIVAYKTQLKQSTITP